MARRHCRIELGQRGDQLVLNPVDRRFGLGGQSKVSGEAGPLCDPLPPGNQAIFGCPVLEAGGNRGLSIAQ